MAVDEAASLAADIATHGDNSTGTWLAFLPSGPRDVLFFPFRVIYQAEVFIIALPRHLVHFIGLDSALPSLLDSTARVFGVGGGDIEDDAAAAAAVIAAMATTDTDGARLGDAAAASA
ncbi:hypothetical protein FQN49_004935, partial [Arthroderma sp. PD_2]